MPSGLILAVVAIGVGAFVTALLLGHKRRYRRTAAFIAWMTFALAIGWIVGELDPAKRWLALVIAVLAGLLAYSTLKKWEAEGYGRPPK